MLCIRYDILFKICTVYTEIEMYFFIARALKIELSTSAPVHEIESENGADIRLQCLVPGSYV